MSNNDDMRQATDMSGGFDDLYQNAPFGYLSMQMDGRILQVNRTLAEWTGYTAEQLTRMKFFDLLTVGTRIFYETSYAPLLSAEGMFDEASLDIRTAAGDALPVTASGNLRKEGGHPVMTRIAFVRSTERRRYERQLVEAHEKSQGVSRVVEGLLKTERETSELREQFIAVLGHDLRNPLAAIAGGLRLVQKEQPPERRAMLFEMLQGSVVRMGGLIDNVLDFARGRLGAGIPLDLRHEIWLEPVLQQVVSELRLGVPDRTVDSDIHLPAPIKCDPSRISQLVSNLLGNALTHGAPGEAVRLHADINGGALTIWVANGGPPIPAAAIEHLFQPFFRGEVRASQQGLGLGLHIASEIAKAHGGTLVATSTPDETRFTFEMPTALK